MPGSFSGRQTAPGGNEPRPPPTEKDGKEFEPYNVSRVGWEPYNVTASAFPGVAKKKVEAPREPVRHFNFEVDPKYHEFELYHQSQLNWLNDQAMARVMREEKVRDFVDQSCGDLKTAIDELEKWLNKIDKEGNEWKSRFENQQEHNNTTGLQILQLTDTIENIRSQIANNEPPLKKFDELTDVRWKKMLKQQEKVYAKLAEELQDVEWRLEEEAKAYFKVNRIRNEMNRELNVRLHEKDAEVKDNYSKTVKDDLLNHYEAKELQAIHNEDVKKQEDWKKKRENPPKKREILEEFGHRPQRTIQESEFDAKSLANTRYTRSRGRFTPRDSGLGSVSRSTSRKMESDAYSDRGESLERSSIGNNSRAGGGVTGSRVPINKKATDPVDALFASTQHNLPAGYAYQDRRGSKNAVEYSRANTRKSALKTDRTSHSISSERNKVSFSDTRRMSNSLDTTKLSNNRQLPPLEFSSGRSRGKTSASDMMSMNSRTGTQPPRRAPPSTNGLKLNDNQQSELNKLIQKPVQWKGY